MIVHDPQKGYPVQIEIHGGRAYVANKQGHLKERTQRFNQKLWDSMVDVFAAETLLSIDSLRPLTGKERFAKLKDSYSTYEGEAGSARQWRQAAEALLGDVATVDQHLVLLGLTELPTDKKTLRKAWLKAIKLEHPDMGGSVSASQLINRAYETLLGRY